MEVDSGIERHLNKNVVDAVVAHIVGGLSLYERGRVAPFVERSIAVGYILGGGSSENPIVDFDGVVHEVFSVPGFEGYLTDVDLIDHGYMEDDYPDMGPDLSAILGIDLSKLSISTPSGRAEMRAIVTAEGDIGVSGPIGGDTPGWRPDGMDVIG